MAENIKNLTGIVEQSQLSGIVSDLVTFIKAQDTNVTNAYKALVGELGNQPLAEGQTEATPHTVKSFVLAKIAEVVASAPEAFDTLKEIADWIGSGDVQNTTAATMLADITKLKAGEDTEGSVDYKVKQAKDSILGDATTDTKESKTIEGVLKYVDDKVSGKNVSAEGETGEAALVSASAADNKVTVASTQKLKDAVARAEGAVLSVTKATSTENYVAITVTDGDNATVAIDDSALNTKIGAKKVEGENAAAATGMYADIQGQTVHTVKDCEDAINAFALATDEQIAAIKALIA